LTISVAYCIAGQQHCYRDCISVTAAELLPHVHSHSASSLMEVHGS